MPNYEHSKIYKLVNTNTNQTYIGSTTRPLSIRFNEHKSKYTTGKKREMSYLLFNDTDDVVIELLEDVNCKNKEELEKKERQYIEAVDCVNIKIPTRTKKEYDDETKQTLKNYHKNREEINKARSEKVICECGSVVAKSALCRHRRRKIHLSIMGK